MRRKHGEETHEYLLRVASASLRLRGERMPLIHLIDPNAQDVRLRLWPTLCEHASPVWS